MAIKEKSYTAEELLRLPDDGKRRELVGGGVREMPLNGAEHGFVAGNIGSSLSAHAENGKLGRAYAAGTGFLLHQEPDTVRAPDAAFVSRERLEEVGSVEGFWPGAPDLVVEVVSPGGTHAEVVEKSLAWLDAGCRMVLVVEPGRKVVTMYRSREDIRLLAGYEVIDGADVVPGWRLAGRRDLRVAVVQDHERYMRPGHRDRPWKPRCAVRVCDPRTRKWAKSSPKASTTPTVAPFSTGRRMP